MKKLFILTLPLFFLFSCKQCIECKYSTLKGSVVEKFCSSTAEDRENFELRMSEEAEDNNSQAICNKERY